MTLKNGSSTGYALLEILIAALVIAFGLLGLAGLQATGLRNNHSAYLASVATQLTYDMADRIRANRGFALASGVNYSTASAVDGGECLSTCTVLVMAQDDLFRWNQSVAAALPGGTTAQPALSNGIYTLTVTWADTRSGQHPASALPRTQVAVSGSAERHRERGGSAVFI